MNAHLSFFQLSQISVLLHLQARANLLDVMLASSRSSSSSSEEEGEDQDPLGYYHLHALHRFRRQKKGKSPYILLHLKYLEIQIRPEEPKMVMDSTIQRSKRI